VTVPPSPDPLGHTSADRPFTASLITSPSWMDRPAGSPPSPNAVPVTKKPPVMAATAPRRSAVSDSSSRPAMTSLPSDGTIRPANRRVSTSSRCMDTGAGADGWVT
jgi:hypothetical protein